MTETVIKIYIKNDEDSIILEDNNIHVIADNKEYLCELSSINEMDLLTTDSGPFADDMCLVIFADNNFVFLVMSEHRCFRPFLFDQIGKVLPIAYQKIIDATTCTKKNIFEIYIKEDPGKISCMDKECLHE